MCYFLGFGPFASTPAEPATERSHSQFCVKNALTPVVEVAWWCSYSLFAAHEPRTRPLSVCHGGPS